MMNSIYDIDQQTDWLQVNNIVKNTLIDIIEDIEAPDFFLHPLGFHYCRLIDTQKNQLRLHFWEADYHAKDDLYIHDHFYDFCSWILNGTIVNYEYQITPSSGESKYTLFKSKYLANRDERTVERTDLFQNVDLIRTSHLFKGSQYFIKRNTFHSNKVLVSLNDIAVTCVYTFNHNEDNAPTIIGYSSNSRYEESKPIPIDLGQIKDICKRALRILN